MRYVLAMGSVPEIKYLASCLTVVVIRLVHL